MIISKRRLDLKIDQLRSQFAEIDHQRDLLRSSYIDAKANEDKDLAEDLGQKLRAYNRQMEAIAAEIRSVSATRFLQEDVV